MQFLSIEPFPSADFRHVVSPGLRVISIQTWVDESLTLRSLPIFAFCLNLHPVKIHDIHLVPAPHGVEFATEESPHEALVSLALSLVANKHFV
jgi:hypothetical protein